MTTSFYDEVLTEHFLHPRHRGELAGASVSRDGVNPSCGDSLRLELQIDNDVIRAAAFSGSGCAISQASADILCAALVGKTTADARALLAQFARLLAGELSEAEVAALGEVASLRTALTLPLRVKCATLAWRTAEELVDG